MIFTKSDLSVGLVALLVSVWCAGNCVQAQQEIQTSFRDGSVVNALLEKQQIEWTNVLPDGQMTTESIAADQIKELWLTLSPASKQVAQIRRFLIELGSPDFHLREAAEKSLSNEKIGGPFRYLIQQQENNPVFEVRYRVKRVLSKLKLKRSKHTIEAKFDKALLKDGRELEGDAGEFQLACKINGQPFQVQRSQLVSFGQPTTIALPVNPPQDSVTLPIQNPNGGAFSNEQTTIDFEKGPDGAELKLNLDCSSLFASQGLLLGQEGKGYVGISGFPFRFPGVNAKENSICVFDTSTSIPKRFAGVMEFRFCVPGQPHVAGGVNELGFYLARVNHNRDFILEGYSDEGHLLCYAEATDQKCVYLGLKSEEPIAFARVLSNPYLYRVDRSVDPDYAVDTISFSTPVPVAIGTANMINEVRLRGGDYYVPFSIQFENDAFKLSMVKTEDGGKQVPEGAVNQLNPQKSLTVGSDLVELVRFEHPLDDTPMDWMAMLPDRSTVRIEPDKGNQSVSFSGVKVPQDEWVGLTFTQNGFRFPMSGDFREGQDKVIVFPTCRLATESFEITNDLIKWSQGATKIIQEIYIDTDPADDEDPTPQENFIDLTEAVPSDLPTIWFSNPKSRDSKLGVVHLTDGQRFMIGSQQKFQIAQMNRSGIEIEWRGKRAQFPWSKVKSILFPKE